MVSIVDVAERAGVGVSTASRVLRGEGYASAEARDKVMRAAEELHYLPNALARSMRGRPMRTIGFLVYDILNPFFANLAAGVEDAAYERDFTVVMCSSKPWKNPEREASYMRMLLQQRIDGLVLQHKFSSDDYARLLERRNIPIVRLVSPQVGFSCDLVRCDTEQAAYGLVSHLISLGHRRIAALGPRLPSSLGNERLAGYQRALAQAGVEVSDELVMLEGWRTRDGYNMVRKLLDRTRPDALFAFGPRIAVGAACALSERGLHIPEDIALVCVDDFGMGSDLDPFMTVARQPEVEMGHQAAQLLFERILGDYKGPPREIVLPARLVIRRSCGALPDRSRLLALGRHGVEHAWEDDD
jgi:LacI family transcriptional regulator